MKTEKRVWTAQACTDCILAHPEISNFRLFFRVCVKFLPGENFGKDFCRFLQIFEDFGYPLGILFGIIFRKNGHLFEGLHFDAFLETFLAAGADGEDLEEAEGVLAKICR